MSILAKNLNPRFRTPLTRLDHREVKSAPPAGPEALDHVLAVKSGFQFVAGHPWLGNHENGRANSQTVAAIHGILPPTFSRAVLAEFAACNRHAGRRLP